MKPPGRSSFGKAVFWHCLSALIAFTQISHAAESQTARPNILFLLADDLRWDALGCAGNPVVRTPNIDRLARRGVMFQNMFVTTSICCVSRASILSGQYARRHGIEDFKTGFTPAAWKQTYPLLLRDAGYRTGFIGKFGVGELMPTNSFDYWDGFPGQGAYFATNGATHLTLLMGDSGLKFIDTRDSRPFCLSISFKAPHAMDGVRREFPPDPADESLYTGTPIPTTRNHDDAAWLRLPPFARESEGHTRWLRRFATPDTRAATIRDYYRLVTGLDREVGRLLDKLDQTGLASNTIVIFTSDNGFFLGERGLSDKFLMYEESIRVPLIIYDPRQPARRQGRQVSSMALNIDLAPTMLDYAGIAAPAAVQGASLRPLIGGKNTPWRDEWFYEHHFNFGGKIPESEGVRTSRWKYIRYPAVSPVVEELYDLRSDPFEQNNLASLPAQAKRLATLRGRWESYRETLR
jgi:arylsulfatase A-like enzyme